MRPLLAAMLFICASAAPTIAHPPYGLVVDHGGDIYFSDLETVWRLSADGRMSVFRPSTPDTHVHELTLAPDGTIEGDQNSYDPATQRYYTGMWSRSLSGIEKDIVPMTERPPAGFGLLKDKTGSRYVTQRVSNDDRRMQLLRRRRDGHTDLLFDETDGASPPIAITVAGVAGIAFATEGSLYFAADDKLRRRAQDGRVTIAYEGGKGSILRGLAATGDGRVLAADMGVRTVLAVGTDGTAIRLYRETGGWLPTAVALDKGRLLILEANANPYEYENRVRLIEVTNGRAKVVASPGEAARSTKSRLPIPKRSGPPNPMAVLAGLATALVLFGGWLLRAKRR